MTTDTYPALLDALREADAAGAPSAGPLTKRLAGWMDQMGFTLIGHDEMGSPLTKPANECTPTQQLKAARFAEYELRDGITLAHNSVGTSRVGGVSRARRAEEYQSELELLMTLVPTRMGVRELESTLTQMVSEAFEADPHTTVSKLVAVVMKRLSTEHPFRYDSRVARDVVINTVSCLLA